MFRNRTFTLPDVIALAAFGSIVALSLLFTLSILASDGVSANLTMCWGPILAGAGGLVLTLRRRSDQAFNFKLWLALVLWFIGALFLGSMPFGWLIGSEDTNTSFVIQLIVMALLCLFPGGFLGGLGLLVYRNQQQEAAEPDATETEAMSGAGAAAAAVETATSDSPTVRRQRQFESTTPRQDKLMRAAEYRRQILDILEALSVGLPGNQEQQLPQQLQTWELRIQQLVQQLNRLEQNEILQRDRAALPQSIADLEARLAAATDPELQTDLQETLDNQRTQLAQLTQLQTLLERGDLDIDETLAAMGTIYSQLHLLDTMKADRQYAQRLSNEVGEQVARLNDMLAAMAQVYRS